MSASEAPTTIVTQVATRGGLTLPVLASVVALASPLVGGIMWFTRLESRITKVEVARADRIQKVDSTLAGINVRLADMATIPLRVTQTETKLAEVNERVDRISQRLLDSIDDLRKKVADLNTSVAVVSSKLDDLSPRPKPTSLRAANP